MADPSSLISSTPVGLLVDHTDFFTARWALRHTLSHAILPPQARWRLARRVDTAFAGAFPAWNRRTRLRQVRRYLDHLSWRHAEDMLLLALPSVPRYIHLVDRHVAFTGAEHWRTAMDRAQGVLLVGAHVGAPVLGLVALLTRYLDMPPQERPSTRLLADPEMHRFPRVHRRLEETWADYHADIRLLITGTRPDSIIAEMDRVLLGGGVASTNLDVLRGGRSRRVFTLFGRMRLRLPALVAAARTALACGATVLPWITVRLPNKFQVIFEPPLGPFARHPRDRLVSGHPDLEALCDRLATRLQAWIATWPEQWTYWDRLHRRLLTEAP